jgi:tetratricopeptide (TPR) repeat protein
MTGCFLVAAVFLAGMDVDLVTADLHVETGMAYISQGLIDEAFGEFTTALELSENAVEAHLGLARVAVINCSWDNAVSEYETYMNLKRNDFRAPLELSEMLLSLRGRAVDALDYAEVALALAPLNSRCWMSVAEAEGSLGNTEEAIRWYTRVIIEDELLAGDARVKMGSLLLQQGDLSEAREVLLPAATGGISEAHHLLALIYMEQNDDLRAIDSINRYLYLEPNGLWADSARTCMEELGAVNTQNN